MYKRDIDIGNVLKPNINRIHHNMEGNYIFKTIPFPGFPHIGLRDNGIITNSKKILAIGDSFTAGVMVNIEDTWVKLTEDSLNGIDVINGGIPGTGIKEAKKFLAKYGISLKPKIILVGYTISNDLIDNSIAQQRAHNPRIVDLFLENYPLFHSIFFKLYIDYYPLIYGIVRRGIYNIFKSQENLIIFSEKDLLYSFYIPDTFQNKWSIFYENGWKYTLHSILEIKDLADTIGARVVVFINPIREQVYWDLIKKPEKYNGIDPLRENKLLAEFCNANGIAVFDPLPQLKANRNSKLYFSYDGHWTRTGNKVIAKAFYDYLIRTKIVQNIQPDDDDSN